MFKYLLLPLMLLTLGVAPTSATADDPSAKVTAVEGSQVTLEITDEMPTWARKGGYLKATNAEGKIVVRGAKIMKVEGKSITVTSTQAKDLKVGTTYKVAKTRVNEGC
ncbi:MAG: hypothetical protein P3B98_08605 [Gemmatimonadota bacterium]|nr:hypothetical protein [Gemmatimonadota bacterium]